VVRDEGPGFSAEDKARMFRRYGRLSARPTGGEPSTGLGLSIVRKLVQGMGGELLCESAAGNGATFIVRLPRSGSA
jgi:two-component system, sensor histidine kinase and response regulator